MDTDTPQSVMDTTVSHNLTTNAPVTNGELLALLKAALDKAFPGVIERLILFGSRVSETATEDSDWDILLLLKNDYDWRLKKNIRSMCYDVALSLNIVLDTKVISRAELAAERGGVMYIQQAFEQGIAA
jgi:predicted nucleotidyltransferase